MERTFVNNPNPPPSADGLSSGVSRPSVIPPPSIETPTPTKETTVTILETEKTEDSFWVSAAGKDGKHKIFNTTSDGEDHEIGTTNNPEVSKILDAIVKKNEFTGAWRGVPKETALSLKSDELGLAEYVHAMYDAGKAGTAEGMIGWQAMSGKMTDAEALDKANPELLKMQVKSAFKPWSDGRLASMASAFPWALGVAAKALPSMVEGVGRGAELAPTVALGTTMMAAAGGPAGLVALATPAGLGSVIGASTSAGMFDFTSRVTAGSIYLDLQRQGIDPKIAKRMAPMAGILAGTLEVVGFKYFTAAAKRTFLAKVMGNTAVKKVMANWASNYLKETGAEAGVESAQQLVEEYTKNFARMADNKPELLMSQKDIAKAAGMAGLEAFVAFGVLKAPMAGIEGLASKTGEGKGKTAAAAAPLSEAEKTASASVIPAAPASASASALEQSLVADSPEVAQAMAELNGELDPTAPDASVSYAEMGKELAGDENVAAAVSAKIEALRMEQSDILAEESNTPVEQQRVAAIQDEINLLGEMQGQMAPVQFEEFGFAEDERAVQTDALGQPLVSEKPISGAKKRIEAAVAKARIAKLDSDLAETLAATKELTAARDRLLKAEKPTRMLDAKLADLQEQMFKLDEQKRALQTGEVAPEKGGALEMKPATLDSVMKIAFKEGRKDVMVKRAGLINQIAEQHGLSDGDVKKLIKNRNLGIMSDLDFKKYVDALGPKAAELAKRKQALIELAAARDEKQLLKEQNLRKIHGLPPVAKMTTAQIHEYVALIEKAETGEEYWTPKRFEALKNTIWAGAESVQDVLAKAAKLFGITPDELKAVKVSEFDRFRYDTALARRNSFYDFMVHQIKEAQIKHGEGYLAWRGRIGELAKTALASRRKLMGVSGKIADWLAPQQAEVMAYMEAETPEAKGAAAALLTPEELELATNLTSFYSFAREYLITNNDLESTRFAGKYMFHARKPMLEVLRNVKETGIAEAWRQIRGSYQLNEANFQITDKSTGQSVGLSKFMRQTLFRSGEMAPSRNVVRATDIYMRQFFNKTALDEAVPTIETVAMALAAFDKTDEGKVMGKALEEEVRRYLNAKKGQAVAAGVVQGGILDGVIRGLTTLMSLKGIALNMAIQVASPVGETMAKIPAVGVSGLAKARYRMVTKQGRAILSKYKYFTGEGVIEEIMHPGQTFGDRMGSMAYLVFKWSRVNTMKEILMANMTDAEFAAGEIDNKRLADIKVKMGRWLDLGGAKSVMGSTSIGAAGTQFKGWAVPIFSSSADLAHSLYKQVAKGEKLTDEQTLELRRSLEATAIAMTVAYVIGHADDQDDSQVGRVLAKVRREIFTLMQGMNPFMFLAAPPAAKWLFDFASNMTLLVQLEKSKTTGELTGWRGLKRQMTPVALKQFMSKETRKGAGPKPIKIKKYGGE